MILSAEEIRALHRKHAPSPEAFDLVYTHSEIVWGVAEQLLRTAGGGADPELVRVGCMLHDIGVYLLYTPSGAFDAKGYVRHGVLGHALLADEGLPEEIRRFCSRHTGVGISAEDVRSQGLPIPVDDYTAETPEEEIVMYADKFHSKTDPPVFVSPGTYSESVARFGRDKQERFAELRRRFGDPDPVLLMALHGHGLV
ncbi:HD domain-containing protein [Nocardiopsis potens]|uniref:HD domain-containing protein n=1 Tax=Nocardiopsis potens TaxID=1246458 RepID=UPI00034A401B|nr:HD domain-containing protein [Nocardiopsis potens]